MLRGREDEPDRERRPQRDTQPSEREDRSDASAPWLLGMQQSAGNQAVARMLAAARARTGRSGTLQRDPVTGTTTESASGGHHPDFRFQFPGEPDKRGYDLDEWAKPNSPKGGPAHAATLNRQDIVNLITAWDGSEPLAYSFSDDLVGTSAWEEWDGQRNVGAEKTVTHDVHHDLTQSEAGKQFAMHFLSLRHMMERRQSDLDATLPPNVAISKSSGKPREKAIESEVPVNWRALLKRARLVLKQKLLAGDVAPATQDDVSIVPDLMFPGPSGDTNIDLWVSNKLLVRGAKNKAKSAQTPIKMKGETLKTKFVKRERDVPFGIGHLSVEIFYEWRTASQLLTLAQAGPAAVVPQQLPVVQPTATETVTETELEPVEKDEGKELVPIGQ
ncbi:hypothetical protein OM076_37070 [Solirubrobacter ginsenosidimutans]|uniref:Uncharacterized protein n=1 Tax=Solirubrobacter ginsenosidimutans TaxID=490573 RepID=A0A9X3N390_9ACTN|nr:hypothetical protein [Solirubrobacter ginsenosidimutans]MDA0165937.1 hypothetical protein [Solirubrobacter ginsenosidimutans]